MPRMAKGLSRLPQIDRAGVGRRLDALRVALGDMEKADFSQSFGLDPSTYSKIVKGDRILKVEYAYAISQLYQVTLEYLYSGSLRDLPDSLRDKIRQNLGGQTR